MGRRCITLCLTLAGALLTGGCAISGPGELGAAEDAADAPTGAPGSEGGEDQPPLPQQIDDGGGGDGEPRITPVLFIPADETVPASTVTALEQALGDVWAWYATQLSPFQLRVGSLVTVHGDESSAYYLDHIWSDGPAELAGKLGFSPWDSGHIVLLVGAGLLGWAGGNGSGQAGFSVVGLESLTASERCAGEWWCNPEMWRGTAIHELGHALTLPHSIDPSIMAFHGDYAQRSLLDSAEWPEKTAVRALPFVFDPGAPPPPEPDTCDGGVPVGGSVCGSGGEQVCVDPGGSTPWMTAPCSPGQSCQGGSCQPPTDGCSGNATLPACNAAPGCAWFACSERCLSNTTSLETGCGCDYYQTLEACDAAPTSGCAWYACSSSCLPEGTPLELGCG